MNRHLFVLSVILVTTTLGLPAMAQKTESLREAEDCVCPKEGRWKAQNLEGWMDCTGPINFKKKLKQVKDKGTIWILEPNCSSVFAEASKKKDEDSLMERVPDCSFEGTINGEEDGVNMVIEIAWTAESDEMITGEMHSNPSMQGMMCEYYRPFELYYDEPIPANKYDDLKKKMEKKLEDFRALN